MLEWSVYNNFKFHKEKPCIDCKIYDGKSINVPCWNGKSLSEAIILTSTNPQYDKKLFIDLPVQYMTTTSSEHVYIICSECQNKKTICVHNMF